MDDFARVTQIAFRDMAVGDIAFDKSSFNSALDDIKTLSKGFVNSIFEIEFHESIGTQQDLATFQQRILFLAAMLRNPNSTLCLALSTNQLSYYNHIKISFKKLQAIQMETDLALGSLMFDKIFKKSVFLDEIKEEFSTNVSLKQFPFPTNNDELATSNLFRLRSGNTAFTLNSKVLMNEIRMRLVDYVALYSTFQQIVQPLEAGFFEMVIHALSTAAIYNNRFLYMLLFQQNNPLSKWIIKNYTNVQNLVGKAFIDAYLNLLFDRNIYTFIFKTIRPFNSSAKLIEIENAGSDWSTFSPVMIQSIIANNFVNYFPFSHAPIHVRLAYLSHSRMNSNVICTKVKQVAAIGINDFKATYYYLDYLTLFLMISDWSKTGAGSVFVMSAPDAMPLFTNHFSLLFLEGTIEEVRARLINDLIIMFKKDLNSAFMVSSSPSQLAVKLIDELKATASHFLKTLLRLQSKTLSFRTMQ